MQLKHYLILLFFGGLSFQLGAQQGFLEGQVLDSSSMKPMEYVSVRLFSLPDSSVATGIYTDTLGKFALDGISPGSYYLRISFAGYRDKVISGLTFDAGNPKRDLGVIGLAINSELQLNEVTITAHQDILKTGIDKKVYNVDQDLSSRSGTVTDILNNVPSIQVDQDGNIILRGDANVTILIDGRPSSLSGGNGKSLLDALPANSIERIEVVTNPSAKYDPDGTSGIINIVLKKNKLKGVNGTAGVTAGTGKLLNANGSFAYRNAKFNVYTNYSLQYREGYRNNYGLLEQSFGDSLSRLQQNRDGTDLRNSNTLRVGSDFYLSERQTLGVILTGNLQERTRTGNLQNELYTNNEVLVRKWERLSRDPSYDRNADATLYYQLDFPEERGSLNFNLNQSFGQERTSGYYEENYYNLDGTYNDLAPLNQQLFNREKNNITTVMLDYVRNYKNKSRMELGAKTIIRDQFVHTYSERRDTLNGNYFPDTLANFDYSYNEQIYSVYGIYGQDLGKFKYQAGLRVEESYQIPFLITDNERIVNNYFNVFPSGHIRYATDKVSEFSISYSRRINRASAWNLNPFTSYADPFNLRRGNPKLQPEFINSFDLGYSFTQKKVTLTANAFYRHTTDVIQRIKEFYPNNTSAVTYENIDQSHSGGLELVGILEPYSWWRNVISVNGNFIRYEDASETQAWNNSGFNWSMKYTGVFQFWKKTASFQLNGRYNSPRITAQGTVRPRMSIDAAVEKSILDGKWTFGARVTDIFNTRGFYFEIDQPTVYQRSEYKWLTRRLYLSVSYKFGKLELSRDDRQGGGAQDGGGFDF